MISFKARAIVAALVIGGVLILCLVLMGQCSEKDRLRREAAQAGQDGKTAGAVAEAAQDAVQAVGGRQVTEQALDAAVANAVEDIGHAEDPAAVRAAVLRAVCVQPSHRNDPACVVRKAHP